MGALLLRARWGGRQRGEGPHLREEAAIRSREGPGQPGAGQSGELEGVAPSTLAADAGEGGGPAQRMTELSSVPRERSK